MQLAKEKNKKGRACGGMLLGIKKDVLIEEKGSREEEEGRMECTVKIGEMRWRVVGVYVNGDMEKKLESLKDWIEEKDVGVRTIIGGDFNARTGEEGGWIEGEEQEEDGKGRKSKDKRIT
ncbi:hypothetical protein RF55_21355 [Lasius niger]|uniref:Endonuclease/exonuclease/phosphatase domain-containing protein n=1 Tax=Lasius niger TaxID=67767 RepID=A0A0J7JYI0_LASNI|nr:hypothetical protein RF55_21355 [Lasius niger]